MKYIHPKLGREAVEHCGEIYISEKGIETHYTEEQILALGFEQMVETPEWIAKIRQQFQADNSDTGYNVLTKAILDNMPKPKKVEENDIRDFVLAKHLLFGLLGTICTTRRKLRQTKSNFIYRIDQEKERR